jgi:signal transduction histidine kinase
MQARVRTRRDRWGWSIALGAVVITSALRAALEPVLVDKSPFLLFTVAVLVSAIYGGPLAGALATAGGGAAGFYFLSMSMDRRTLLAPGHLLQGGLYLGVCCGIVQLVEALRRARRRAEESATEQAALAGELNEANQAKDQFLAMVSHELRNPLNAIVGWADLLVNGTLGESEVKAGVEVIQRNARLQDQLISDLLDVSRIVAGKLRLRLEPVEPFAAVQLAVEAAQPAALAKRIDLDLAGERGDRILADPERLQQICWNLLTNAVKFTPEGGRIDVRLRSARGAVVITVTDNGPGIDLDFLPHVFDRFRQGTAKAGGLGLGMAITRQLVEMHGGTIRAGNVERGSGAVFEVRLPLTSRAEPPPFTLSSPVLEGVRVLALDQDEQSCQWMSRLLREYGADVSSTPSSAVALSEFRRERPDVIVVVAAAEDRGDELLKGLRALAPSAESVPTVLVGGRDHEAASGIETRLPASAEPAELALAIAALVLRTGAHVS